MASEVTQFGNNLVKFVGDFAEFLNWHLAEQDKISAEPAYARIAQPYFYTTFWTKKRSTSYDPQLSLQNVK